MAATDAELVGRALAGSERAYREIVRRYERSVFGLIARIVRDPALAEDLAQETFVKAFARLDTYDPQRKLSTWLLRIAHNHAIDSTRRRSIDTVPLDVVEAGEPMALAGRRDETPAELAERAELAKAIEAAIGRLRPEHRELVVLRYQQGLAYEELVEVTGLPLGTVKSYLHRARKALADELSAAGWRPPAETRGGRHS